MRPTPPYNSSWARVPVTNYRPQIMNDPLSGNNFTSIQPCKTYEWQMRRTAGCSLWHRFVSWWQSRCTCFGRTAASLAVAQCDRTGEWIVDNSTPTDMPYYSPSSNAPSTNGRLVPVPSGVSPSSPTPADSAPQLDPRDIRSGGEGADAWLSPPDTEVFVRTIDRSDTSLELVPPLVTPAAIDPNTDGSEELPDVPPLLDQRSDAKMASAAMSSRELLPVSWSTPNQSQDTKIPTDEVWDDTGWQSVR
ncbi:MAG: hypothetical protein H8E66_03830 [Planctomycetes bacterium]|nr:hypothetical protein [Planctomycetota bacterium]